MKNPWPLAVSVLYGGFAVLLLSFATYAMRNPTDLVRQDYYAHEINYQQQIDRELQAAEWKAEDLIRVVDAGLIITLPAGATDGALHLYRPSDAALDRELTLQPDAQGRAVLPISELKPGAWRVRLDWQQAGRPCFKERTVQVAP